jgi:hypothetical protein
MTSCGMMSKNKNEKNENSGFYGQNKAPCLSTHMAAY